MRQSEPATRAPRVLRSLAAALVFTLAATPVGAEIYRCVGADGSVRFTSRADACPDAQAHEPKGTIQQVPYLTRPAPKRPERAGVRAPAARDEAVAAQWRARKAQAEQERAHLAKNAEPYRQVVTWCNRGASLHARDRHGIPEDYDCESAREQYAELQRRLDELEAYLGGGLAEECRLAGCLPGWIR